MRQVPESEVWINEFTNNLSRIAQGVGTRMPKGNNTIFFIPIEKVPKGKTVTYRRIFSEIMPHKTEIHRVCLGGRRKAGI